MSQPEQAKLKPARPVLEAERASYMPRIPWRYVLIGAMSLATVVLGYTIKERQRADTLRSQILRVHEELKEPRDRYLALRDRLEKLVLEAGSGAPQTFVDKRLRMPGLRSGQGLYLRIPTAAAKQAKTIRKAAAEMEGDAIGACLGLTPTSARGFFEQGEFLTSNWIAKTKTEDSVMHLRVTDEMLARRIENDLPTVLSTLRSDWFLLVLEQGADCQSAPVDVFLWDLRREQKLLATRVMARGALMPVHVRMGAAPAAPSLTADDLEGAGATDCSIASQVKELAGLPAATMQNLPASAAELLPPARSAATVADKADKSAASAAPATPTAPAAASPGQP